MGHGFHGYVKEPEGNGDILDIWRLEFDGILCLFEKEISWGCNGNSLGVDWLR